LGSWRSTAELLPLSRGTQLAYHHLPAVTTVAGHAAVALRLASTVELALDRTAEGGCPYMKLRQARELRRPFVFK
jgi:hypothetical protein